MCYQKRVRNTYRAMNNYSFSSRLLCQRRSLWIETTHNLDFTAPFFQPSRRIGLDLLMPTQAYQGYAVECCIDLAVASAIEAMTIGLARTAWQGGGTIGADAVGLPKARAGLLAELVEVVQQLSDLPLQAKQPPGNKAQGLFRCRHGGIDQGDAESSTGDHEVVMC